MCKVLGVSSSGFYDWRFRDPSKRNLRKCDIMKKIQEVFKNSRRLYGAPRVHHALKSLGIYFCRSTVSRWMNEAGLFAKTKLKFRVATTDSNHKLPIAENILNRQFDNRKPGEVLTSDITYIPTGESWLYLAVTLDLATKKAAGWSMNETMKRK